MFNSLDNESWRSIVEISYQSKIQLTKITTLSYSANSVVQDNRKKGLETDFVLHFRKTSDKVSKLINVSEEEEKKEILSLVKKYKKQNKTYRSFEIINYVVIGLLKKKIFFNISIILQNI